MRPKQETHSQKTDKTPHQPCIKSTRGDINPKSGACRADWPGGLAPWVLVVVWLGYQGRVWLLLAMCVEVRFCWLHLRCMGWSLPLLCPPLATGLMWSAVGLSGCGNLSFLLMGLPHHAHMSGFGARVLARLRRYIASLVRVSLFFGFGMVVGWVGCLLFVVFSCLFTSFVDRVLLFVH